MYFFIIICSWGNISRNSLFSHHLSFASRLKVKPLIIFMCHVVKNKYIYIFFGLVENNCKVSVIRCGIKWNLKPVTKYNQHRLELVYLSKEKYATSLGENREKYVAKTFLKRNLSKFYMPEMYRIVFHTCVTYSINRYLKK